jgi:hypothetical protein
MKQEALPAPDRYRMTCDDPSSAAHGWLVDQPPYQFTRSTQSDNLNNHPISLGRDGHVAHIRQIPSLAIQFHFFAPFMYFCSIFASHAARVSAAACSKGLWAAQVPRGGGYSNRFPKAQGARLWRAIGLF